MQLPVVHKNHGSGKIWTLFSFTNPNRSLVLHCWSLFISLECFLYLSATYGNVPIYIFNKYLLFSVSGLPARI